MDEPNDSTEYPTDYIDIVNEINDFIASLDAPPLDNHTQELVGTSERRKFGQHSDASFGWSGSRSRHASGEQIVSNQFCVAKQEDDMTGDGVHGDVTSFPFPLVDDASPDYGIYDNKDSGSTTKSTDCGEYSDCSNYGGVYSAASSSCSGDVADSDSGCYSHYQHPRSDTSALNKDSVFLVSLGSSCPAAFSSSSSYSSNTFSGSDRGHVLPPSSLSAASSRHPSHQQQQQQQQHTRPQSPDRLSAEFHCDPDTIDRKFHQVGSSAHTLAASSARSVVGSSIDHDYLGPSSITKVPESPVPKRLNPGKFNKVGDSQVPGTSSPGPLSTSPHPLSSSPNVREREVTYSVIQKPASSNLSQSCPQKSNIKTRWPPGGAHIDQHSRDLSPGKFSANRASRGKGKSTLKECQDQFEKQQTGADSSSANESTVSGTRVPDLSVLISELRSASPRSELSPSSSYTSTARSESVSPKNQPRPETQSPTCQSKSEDRQDSVQSLGHQSRAEHSKPRQTKQGVEGSSSQSPSRPSKSDSQSAKHKPEPRTLSPSHGQPVNGVTYESESPDHDYEPIENLQLEVLAACRTPTKISQPQGPAMADTGTQQPKHVKALHNFKGANNDELCFKKGDIITLTQCIEGGWWEGTLNGRTGWFPSNYTKEVKADISYKNNKSGDVPVYKRESMQLYHNVVLKNVIETEKTHVSEMLKVLQSYIKPLESTSILTATEYNLLVGNIEEIIAFQQSFLSALEECERLPSSQRRIGGIFMQFAPRVKELYSAYCANHPKAVSVLQKKREELGRFVEAQGAPPPGAQTLTTILSKPFTRLDRYPSLLKELERHVEESHPDRGDTQRAIAVYRNIANSCLEIRKLKEMEFEIITSTIQGWEGEEISKLGEVIHLSQVKMITQTGDKYERIFVLFSSCLVMLSMSARLSSYQYEGKIPLSGLSASPCDSSESSQNAFEISGPMIEKIEVLCGTKSEVTAWLDILSQQLSQSGNPAPSPRPQPLQVLMTTTCQTSVSTVTPAKIAQISSNPPTAPPPQFPLSSKMSSVWTMSCLRPSPPLRPTLMCREEVLKSPRAGRKSTHKRKPVRTYSGEETDWHSKNDPKVYNEDAYILQVIEAYCNSIKTRHTVNSCRIEVAKNKPNDGKAILDNPQILLAEEEKVFDDTEQQERTVVDTVYALQDRVKELEQEQRKLRQDLEEERRCRKKLEVLVRQQVIKSSIVDGVPEVGS